MACEDLPQVTITNELRDTLLEFTINYLVEQPACIPEFGIEFFTKMKNKRQTKIYRNQKEIDEYRRLCGDAPDDAIGESLPSLSVQEVEMEQEPKGSYDSQPSFGGSLDLGDLRSVPSVREILEQFEEALDMKMAAENEEEEMEEENEVVEEESLPED